MSEKRNMVKHYEITRWVDFVRGMAPGDESDMMRSHLDGGCEECSQLAGFCRRLARTCQAIVTDEVPEPVVRRALAIFPARKPERRWRALRIPVELVFDSFLMPVPAGLRSTWQVGWQGLYRAGECSLDLRIEPDPQSMRATIVGQVSNLTAPGQELSISAVCLKSGQEVVAETVGNRFGEFQLEYEQRGDLQLCVYLDAGARCLQVPVKRLAEGKEPDRDPAGDSKNLGND